jgi:hypothetical protein
VARAGWEAARTRLTAVDWARVGLVVLPIVALLFAGLAGYMLGRRQTRPSASLPRIASATRGWREETPAPGTHPLPTAPGPVLGTPGSPATESPLPQPATRFRDFRISASSWELANPPQHAADGDPYTFWHAWQTERFANGEWLTLTFPTERLIQRIGLMPGRFGPRARVDGRVRSILVKASGAPPQKLLFQDRPEMQIRDLKQPVRARKLILRIVTVLPGRRTDQIVVPEVQVWGSPAPSRIAQRPGE